MALQLLLRRLGLVTRAATLTPHKLRARGLGSGGGSCAGGRPPPCAPCEPAAQPACRARPPAVRHALRVVCCPPPRGARPPCAPREPSCGLTCRDAIDQGRTISTRVREEEECLTIAQSCGGETDRVARRLALARQLRRRDYECEVARAAAVSTRPAAAPVATYRLGGERECVRATDGCLYAMPARCGPDRTPPPPRCVELAPDDNCRIREEARLDPCAHRPRVMIEIDRRESSATATGSKTSPTDAGAAPPRLDNRFVNNSNEHPKCPCANVQGASTEGLTSRIIKTLNLGGSAESGGGGPNCPRAASGGKCVGSGARRAGDDSWCAALPPPAPAPARCRRPSLADRLRARTASPRAGPRGGRGMHTSAARGASGVATAASAGSLEDTLRKRSELKEAGRGRIVVGAGEGGSKRGLSPGGRLDIPVPPGTERVRVRVSLDRARLGPCAVAEPAPRLAGASCGGAAPAGEPIAPSASVSACRRLAEDGQKSWLSIKNIQKKFSGSRRGEEAGSAPPRPGCAPPRPARPPPCPAPPRAPAPAPPPPSVCGGRRPKAPEPGPKKCISISTVILPPDAILAAS